MKQVKIDEYKNKKKNIRNRKIVSIVVIILVIAIIIITVSYMGNKDFRDFIDRSILRKEVSEQNVQVIEVDLKEIKHICAYDRYIGILNKGKLQLYSNNTKKEHELDIDVSDPLFDVNNRFLVMGQKAGQKVYLITGSNILWQKELEGEITKVHVNKNGYVAIVISGTAYKTVVIIYDPTGKELFKTYLSTTNAIDVDISSDNKYLCIAEVDTSGTLIQSNIKIVSFEKAQTDTANSIIYKHQAQIDSLILDVKYQDRNRLVCLYNDGIHIIEDENDEEIMTLIDKKDIFADIALQNHVVKVVEKPSGLFTADSQIQITNTNNRRNSVYTAEGVTKRLYTSGEIIALHLGTEIHFINTGGWLVKKYFSSQEVKDIVMNNNFAGIVYSDKIEIVNF